MCLLVKCVKSGDGFLEGGIYPIVGYRRSDAYISRYAFYDGKVPSVSLCSQDGWGGYIGYCSLDDCPMFELYADINDDEIRYLGNNKWHFIKNVLRGLFHVR